MVDILDTEGEVAAKAHCELVVDGLDLGLKEWEGMLRDVAPPDALSEGDHCRLRLPNGGQGEIVVSHVFPRGAEESPVCQFLGRGAPPEVPSEARP
jgi:hypothetical protein